MKLTSLNAAEAFIATVMNLRNAEQNILVNLRRVEGLFLTSDIIITYTELRASSSSDDVYELKKQNSNYKLLTDYKQ